MSGRNGVIVVGIDSILFCDIVINVLEVCFY